MLELDEGGVDVLLCDGGVEGGGRFDRLECQFLTVRLGDQRERPSEEDFFY